MNIAEQKFAKAMQSARATTPTKGELDIGAVETGGVAGLNLVKLLDGRLLVQGQSGAGKSWSLRRVLEQSAGLVQQIVVDPEGEFRSFADEYELVAIDGQRLDTAALAETARRARAHRISLLLDLSELDREDQMDRFAAFVAALVEAPREHWHACLVAVDEAHLFAPFGGQATEAPSIRKAAIGALVDLMSRGRKRGLAGIIATQRLARLSKSVVSEAQNFLIGTNTLDLDIRRAAETIGWDARRAFDRLPALTPGDFVAIGPAFRPNPAVLRVGPVNTKHTGAAPQLKRPDNIGIDDASKLLDLDALMDATADDEAARAENALVPGLKVVRAFIRDAAFPAAGRLLGALLPLFPAGATLADLQAHFGRETEGAIALLDRFGALEFIGDGEGRIVRVAEDMRS